MENKTMGQNLMRPSLYVCVLFMSGLLTERKAHSGRKPIFPPSWTKKKRKTKTYFTTHTECRTKSRFP